MTVPPLPSLLPLPSHDRQTIESNLVHDGCNPLAAEPERGLTPPPSPRARLSSLVFVGGWRLASHMVKFIDKAVEPLTSHYSLEHAHAAVVVAVAFGFCAVLVILS